jgi:hypothetical protein
MTRYRKALPQLGSDMLLTDSGLETDLLFNHGVDLPEFAAFPLLDDPDGAEKLRDYYRAHAPSTCSPRCATSSLTPAGHTRSAAASARAETPTDLSH